MSNDTIAQAPEGVAQAMLAKATVVPGQLGDLKVVVAQLELIIRDADGGPRTGANGEPEVLPLLLILGSDEAMELTHSLVEAALDMPTIESQLGGDAEEAELDYVPEGEDA